MIISVLNQKGGVGKTTVAVNLSASFSRQGSRVLLVDADSQGSVMDWAAARMDKPLFHVTSMPQPVLHKKMDALRRGYDFVIIDTPPRAEAIARSAIQASDLVLIPVEPSPLDLWASDQIVHWIMEGQSRKDNLHSCFVINRRIEGTVLGRTFRKSLKQYPFPVLRSTIVQRIIFAETFIKGRSVYEAADGSLAAKEIQAVKDELIEEYSHEQ